MYTFDASAFSDIMKGMSLLVTVHSKCCLISLNGSNSACQAAVSNLRCTVHLRLMSYQCGLLHFPVDGRICHVHEHPESPLPPFQSKLVSHIISSHDCLYQISSSYPETQNASSKHTTAKARLPPPSHTLSPHLNPSKPLLRPPKSLDHNRPARTIRSHPTGHRDPLLHFPRTAQAR